MPMKRVYRILPAFLLLVASAVVHDLRAARAAHALDGQPLPIVRPQRIAHLQLPRCHRPASQLKPPATAKWQTASTPVVWTCLAGANSDETSRGQSHQAGLVAAPAGVLIGTPAGGKSGGGVLGAE